MPIWTPENTQLTTATSVTNGLNTLLEYVGSVGKYSCGGRLRGLDARLTGFGKGSSAERRVRGHFVIPVASGGEFRCRSGLEGRPCWAGLWQKASIARYHSFFCALSAMSLIAPLALPTVF